jgi:transketolase C-terminal domain/subunit
MVKYVRTDMSEKADSWKSVVMRWLEYARDDPDVAFVGADSFWAYLDRFDPKLKDWFYSSADHMRRMVRCGIAEANMVTVAAGLADQGLKVYCQTMGWLFERAYNMIAASVCIDRHNVTMVARSGGIGGGPTHQNTRHIAWSRPIPNLICMAAADAVEAVKMAEFAANTSDLRGGLSLQSRASVAGPRGRRRVDHCLSRVGPQGAPSRGEARQRRYRRTRHQH